MLDQKDLEAFRGIMKEEITRSEVSMKVTVKEEISRSEASMRTEIARSEEAMKATMKEEIAKSEATMKGVMRKEITRSENLILDELERTRNILESRINKMQEDMDELKQYYHLVKLENENAKMLFRMIEDLSKRVLRLEQKTA